MVPCVIRRTTRLTAEQEYRTRRLRNPGIFVYSIEPFEPVEHPAVPRRCHPYRSPERGSAKRRKQALSLRSRPFLLHVDAVFYAILKPHHCAGHHGKMQDPHAVQYLLLSRDPDVHQYRLLQHSTVEE